MAEQAPAANEEQAAAIEQVAAEPSKTSILARIKVILFVVAVIVVECLVAYLYIPSAAETAAMAEASLGANPSGEGLEGEGSLDDKGALSDQIEVDLGEFSVVAYQPISNSTLRIDFRLFGTVGAEDEKEFLALKDENLHRFRDQVIVTVRSADITDLTDAGLGLVKRKILEQTNRTLGRPLLRAVVFSDFSFIEQ